MIVEGKYFTPNKMSIDTFGNEQTYKSIELTMFGLKKSGFCVHVLVQTQIMPIEICDLCINTLDTKHSTHDTYGKWSVF